MAEKSILEKALLQVETLEEAVKANAKGILASTMKEEINDLLKEQEDENPEEEPQDVEGVDAPEDNDEPSITDDEPKLDEPSLDGVEDEVPDLDGLADEVDDDVLDMTGASEDEVLKVFKAMKPEDGIVVKKDGDTVAFSDEGNDYIIKLDDEEAPGDEPEVPGEEPELPVDEPELPEGLNEDEVVYEIELDEEDEDQPFTEKRKAKKGEPKEAVNVTDTVGDNEPFDKKAEAQVGKGVTKLQANEQEGTKRPGTPVPGAGSPETKEPGKGGGKTTQAEKFDGTSVPGVSNPDTKEPGKGGEKTTQAEKFDGTSVPGVSNPTKTEPDGDGVSQAPEAKEELVKKETKEEKEECDECGDEVKEVEATEAARTKWNPHGDKGPNDRAGIKSKKIFKAGSGELNEEVETLRKQNKEYKKALLLFKDKLNEVALFNANLAHSTRLFTEHSTTKQEKLNILKRFDSISTITESKNLYTSIKGELDVAKPISETLVDKVASTKTSSSSEVLSESKAYENPQFKRMKDLMSKLK